MLKESKRAILWQNIIDKSLNMVGKYSLINTKEYQGTQTLVYIRNDSIIPMSEISISQNPPNLITFSFKYGDTSFTFINANILPKIDNFKQMSFGDD